MQCKANLIFKKMNSCKIVEIINLKTQNDGKDYKTSDIDGYQADYVRQVFRQHERATLTAGQGVFVIGESKESRIALGKSPELFIGTEHRISTPKSDRSGMEDNSKGSIDIC